jgi:hypothetical protein
MVNVNRMLIEYGFVSYFLTYVWKPETNVPRLCQNRQFSWKIACSWESIRKRGQQRYQPCSLACQHIVLALRPRRVSPAIFRNEPGPRSGVQHLLTLDNISQHLLSNVGNSVVVAPFAPIFPPLNGFWWVNGFRQRGQVLPVHQGPFQCGRSSPWQRFMRSSKPRRRPFGNSFPATQPIRRAPSPPRTGGVRPTLAHRMGEGLGEGFGEVSNSSRSFHTRLLLSAGTRAPRFAVRPALQFRPAATAELI